MSDAPHPQAIERLKWPLWGIVIAALGLGLTIAGATVTIAWTVIHWVDTQENLIALNQAGVLAATHDVGILQGNIVSLDKRVNELTAKVNELHNLSDAADRELKARLDTIDALAKFNTERLFQQQLPQPRQGPR
jgi:peptidoglycan hydrolase CwlO-like protein